MAGLTAGVVVATLLRFLVLSAGVSRGSAIDALCGILGCNSQYCPPPSSPPSPPPPPPAPAVVNIFTKQNPDLFLDIDNNRVVLSRKDGSDKAQQWELDSTSVGSLRDEQGKEAFAIVNRLTNQAIVSSKTTPRVNGAAPVELATYDAGNVLATMLWTMGDDLGDGYREIRWLLNISETLNALHGSNDGAVVGVYPASPTHLNSLWKTSTPITT